MGSRFVLSLIVVAIGLHTSWAEDPVFSGPQVGEALVSFQVVAVYGESAGQQMDPIHLAEGKPTLLVFVHKLTRPGIALARGLSSYAKQQKGTASGVVWLADDKAKADEYLTRAKTSLNFTAPVGISVDGLEGPGAYGLNRNVELTILVAKDNRVTANFALVQPSVTEGPKIAGELAKLVGVAAPSADEFQKLAYPGRGGMNMRRNQAGGLRSMMQKLIAAGSSENELKSAAQAVERWVGDNRERQAQLLRMSGAVMESGRGSEEARAVIKAWQAKYGQSGK